MVYQAWQDKVYWPLAGNDVTQPREARGIAPLLRWEVGQFGSATNPGATHLETLAKYWTIGQSLLLLSVVLQETLQWNICKLQAQVQIWNCLCYK